MKNFYSPLWYLLWCTCFVFISISSKSQSFSHPSTGTIITGDVMHAASGNEFIGVVYSRSGSVYYNQLNSEGVWGEEALMGTGSAARLAIDKDGHPHVVYTTTATPTKIAYLKYNGSTWSEVEYIESLNNGGAGNCSKPDMAIAINGDVHITYTDSHGSTGDDYTHPDIMYAKKTTAIFNIQLIYRGYRDYSSSGSWGADYFSKGSYIAVNESGDYFIIAHRQNIWRWYAGTDNTYFIMISSNLGSGNISNYGSDIFTIHDLEFNGTSVLALYKQTTFKTSELTVSGTTISFSNTQEVSTVTSVSSVTGNNANLAVGGKNLTDLFTQYNSLGHVYEDAKVKNTIVSVVETDGVFYAIYTDSGDNMLKIREVAIPLSITRFELPGQDGPTVIDGRAGTIDITFEGSPDLSSNVAAFTTTNDVTAVSVESVPQTSGVTINDFSNQITYALTDGVTIRNWLVNVRTQLLNTLEISICMGETYVFGTQLLSEPGEYTEVFESVSGTDSIVILTLSVNPIYNNTADESICQGETFVFGTQNLTSAGEYTEVFESKTGCDSTVVLTLTVNPEYNHTSEESICQGDIYVFGTQNLSSAGEYIEVFESETGCDSTVVLTLSVNPTYNNTDEASICQGDTYVFGTQSLTTAGEYTEVFESETGCDSTAVLTLTVNPVFNNTAEVAICQGENYAFGTQTLTTEGEYTEVFESETGCDSTVVLSLIVNPVFNHTAEAGICQGDTYIFGTQTLTTAGEYTEVFESETGCDSTVVLTLIVNPVYNHTTEADICQGDTYIFGTQTLTTAGKYTEEFESKTGCDSTVVLTLTVNPIYNHTAEVAICQGENYAFGTQILTSAGEYTEVFESKEGCDSTVVLTLTVNLIFSHTDEATICHGENYVFGSQTLTTAGEYTEVFESKTSCDSTVVLTLTVNPIYNHTAEAAICQGETYTLGSQTLSATGVYTEVFESKTGCDSTVVLTLSVDPVYNHTAEAAVCQGESFVFGTQILTSAGEYTEVFKSKTECDSTIVLTLTVNPIYNHIAEAVICQGENYVFGTKTLTTAGEYTEVFESKTGCDSTVVLTLTVNPIFNHTAETTICQGENYVFGSQTLTSAGEYTEVFESKTGCDSTVVLTLTVNPAYNHSAEAEICQGDAFAFGTQILSTTGQYTEVFESKEGCDSTVVLTLTVNPVYNVSVSNTIYSDELPYIFGNYSITEGGTYNESFLSVSGCDSLVTLNLVVKPADIIPPALVCQPINIRLNSLGHYKLNNTDIQQLTSGTTDNETAYNNLAIQVVPDAFSCEMAGTNVSVTITATDLKGNSSTANTSVNVTDQTPPDIMCKNVNLALDEFGQARLVVSDLYSLATDACGILSVTTAKTNFDTRDLGSQTLQVTATDLNGNTNTCTSFVEVKDLLPPQITPVQNLVVNTVANLCETIVNYPEIQATDNCGVKEIYLINGLGPNGKFPIGNSVERWVAADESGNRDTINFEIIVMNIPAAPSMDEVEDVEMPEDTSGYIILLSNIYDGSNCNIYPLEFSLSLEKPTLFQSYQFSFLPGKDSAQLQLVPSQDAFGETSAIIKVVNEETGKQFSDTFNIRVKPVNDSPFIVQPIGNMEINAAEVWKMYFSPHAGTIFDDVDDEHLQLLLKGAEHDSLPVWASFSSDSLWAAPAAGDAGCTNFILTATDAEGASTYMTFKICVNIPVDAETLPINQIKTYPNPTSGKFYIDFPQSVINVTDVTVFNSLGMEVFHKKVGDEKRMEINLGNHTSGMYILKATGVDFNFTQKIILKTAY